MKNKLNLLGIVVVIMVLQAFLIDFIDPTPALYQDAENAGISSEGCQTWVHCSQFFEQAVQKVVCLIYTILR